MIRTLEAPNCQRCARAGTKQVSTPLRLEGAEPVTVTVWLCEKHFQELSTRAGVSMSATVKPDGGR